ncbi:hypothetical protein QBC44DRAFT_82527 [Cladorrhinum sp. PSN332]|nr:hypothetical protein QBC44DRAFT_82527 [Cladorrhinum sp. PSN332]
MASTSQTGTKQFPGFGLPVEHFAGRCFPHAVAKSWGSQGVTLRELRMMGFINQITDKPNWEDKVFDDEIVSRWRAEAEGHGLLSDNDVYMSKQMFDFCIEELKDKSEHFKKTGRVNVLDAELVVIKSDKAVCKEVQKELQEGVKVLEDVPEHKKDWHPGSEDTVLDLVHPSLFPVVWGVTRVLEEGTVPLENCIDYTGKGAPTTAATKKSEDPRRRTWGTEDDGYGDVEDYAPKSWGSYQWLPAEVAISAVGSAKVTSYINNLHPVEHKNLYPVLERVVAATVPLWEDNLNGFADRRRIGLESTGSWDYSYPPGIRYRIPGREGPKSWYDPVKETYHATAKDEEGEGDKKEAKEDGDEEDDDDEEEEEDDDEDDDWKYEDEWRDWKETNRVLVYLEPREYAPQSKFLEPENVSKKIKVLGAPISLKNTNLQIIFKLANIYLSPENPEYEGGSWHVEGTLNEMICASAIYYYDQENITDSHLAFAHTMDTQAVIMIPEQSEFSSIETFLGVQSETSGMASQSIGEVHTREGRLLTFPNCLRHQVQPFRLEDETKPGHRKILAMFLIDPNRPVLSSAHVPPQRRDWWADKVRNESGLSGNKVPPEVFDMVMDEVEDFPLSWEQALEHREKLMEERGFMNDELDTEIEQLEFSFCEH